MQSVKSLRVDQFPEVPTVWEKLGNVWESAVERPLDAIGLLERPQLRGVVLGAAAAGLIYFAKPDAQFYNGKARRWSITSPGDETATPFTWWFVGATVGLLTGVLV